MTEIRNFFFEEKSAESHAPLWQKYTDEYGSREAKDTSYDEKSSLTQQKRISSRIYSYLVGTSEMRNLIATCLLAHKY